MPPFLPILGRVAITRQRMKSSTLAAAPKVLRVREVGCRWWEKPFLHPTTYTLVPSSFHRRCGYLRYVQQFRGCFRNSRECIAEHGVAKWTGRTHDGCSGCHQLFGASNTYPLSRFFAEECQSSASAATEGTLASSWRVDHISKSPNHVARLV